MYQRWWTCISYPKTLYNFSLSRDVCIMSPTQPSHFLPSNSPTTLMICTHSWFWFYCHGVSVFFVSCAMVYSPLAFLSYDVGIWFSITLNYFYFFLSLFVLFWADIRWENTCNFMSLRQGTGPKKAKGKVVDFTEHGMIESEKSPLDSNFSSKVP